ncbi:MAG: glycosyltransferase [Candidatus Omnitrophica bacterium]|nr:glycosyltransferase [Candidatus Omnitrophota bacterium]
MNILLINPYSAYGGAEKIACYLVSAYNRLGHRAILAVSHRPYEHQFIAMVQQPKAAPIHKICTKLNQFYSKENFLKKVLRQIEQPGGIRKILTGREKYNCIDFDSILDVAGFIPDIVHFHNTRDNLLGPKLISSAGIRFPVVITLHDLWFLTGKCIQPGRCNGWKNSCSNCPESWFPFATVKNGIRRNLREKIEIISKTKPYVCAPSLWAMNIIKQSYIGKAAAETKVIHNGVNLSVYKPGNKNDARTRLGLQTNKFVLLSSGRDLKTNRYKNFRTLEKVSIILGNSSVEKQIIFLCLGNEGKTAYYRNLEMRFIPFITNENTIADFYRAADVYLHTAEYETWGLTVTEAMACGIPVVAFSNGGVREQIINGKTGFLIENNNPESMAYSTKILLENIDLRKNMSEIAFKHARENFDIEDTASKYLEFYEDILKKNEHNRH